MEIFQIDHMLFQKKKITIPHPLTRLDDEIDASNVLDILFNDELEFYVRRKMVFIVCKFWQLWFKGQNNTHDARYYIWCTLPCCISQ